jgi:hypothetical protein
MKGTAMKNMFSKENLTNNSLSFLGFFIAVGLIIASSFISMGLRDFRGNVTVIEVKGFSETRVVSDFATWSGNFSVRDPSMTVAYEKMEKDKESVLKYLEKLGLPREQIKFSPARIMADYKRDEKGNSTNDIEYYSAEIDFNVEAKDTALIESVSKQSTDLIRQGVKFTSFPANFFYTKLEETKLALLEAASKDAKTRAATIAHNGGGTLGALKSARQGVFQVTREHSQEVSDYGFMDTSTVVKSVRAVVSFTYGLKG